MRKDLYTPKMHRAFLLGTTVLMGVSGSVTFYFLERDAMGNSVPLVLIIANTLISFAGGLLGAEMLWRINKWYDSL